MLRCHWKVASENKLHGCPIPKSMRDVPKLPKQIRHPSCAPNRLDGIDRQGLVHVLEGEFIIERIAPAVGTQRGVRGRGLVPVYTGGEV